MDGLTKVHVQGGLISHSQTSIMAPKAKITHSFTTPIDYDQHYENCTFYDKKSNGPN